MAKIDKLDSMLVAIALKETLIEDTSLHHNLIKYDVEDIDNALMRAKRYSRLEDNQKNKPMVFVATISSVPSRMDESRRLEKMVLPLKRKVEAAKYSFQPQHSDCKRRYDP